MEEDDHLLEASRPPTFPWCRRLLQLSVLSSILLLVGLSSPATRLRLSGVVQLADKGFFPLIRGGTRMYGEEEEDEAVCVGHVLSSGAWLAAAGLKISAAVQECNPRLYGDQVPEDLRVSTDPSDRNGLCARNILGPLRDLTQVSQLLEGAATACNAKKVPNIKCATAVTNSLRQSFHFSRFASELSVYCPVDETVSLFVCINRVEGIGWSLDAMLASISQAARLCAGEKLEPRADYGSCTGEVLGAAAYIAAAGLGIWTAQDFECLSAQNPKDLLTLTQEEKDEINARCALFSLGAARDFAIATSKATEAAGHCGATTNTNCGRSYALGAAAISSAAEAMSIMRLECISPLSCCEFTNNTFQCDCTTEAVTEIREENYILRGRCARFTTSMLKSLSVAVSLLSEGSGECTTETAKTACASFVGGAMAGFFFLMEAIARSTMRCKNNLQRFFCSQDIGFMGESMDMMSHAIGAALRDCGVGAAPRQSNYLSFGRRFFLP